VKDFMNMRICRFESHEFESIICFIKEAYYNLLLTTRSFESFHILSKTKYYQFSSQSAIKVTSLGFMQIIGSEYI